MKQEVSTKKISSKESLKEVISDLSSEVEITIPHEISPYELSELMNNPKIGYLRKGFKKWHVYPKVIHHNEINRYIVAGRIITLILSAIFFVWVVYWLISIFWVHLESYFISLPLSSGIISGAILMVIPLLINFISKKKSLTLLKAFLGIDYER